MSKILSHNFTGKSIVVVYVDPTAGVQQRIVEQSHVNWPMIMDCYKEGKYDDMLPLLSVTGFVGSKSGGKFSVVGNSVYYNGQPTHGYMFDQMLNFFKNMPKQFDRLVKFAENLYQNPEERARQETYKFLDQRQMPLTDDGCFLAYKGVDSEFYSVTAGIAVPTKGKTKATGETDSASGKPKYKIFNGVGEVVEVKRDDCNPNPAQDCSYGLHVGNYRYADGFKQGHLMIVKVNPRDVISVPHSDAQKMRVCRYEVIGEVNKPLDAKRNRNYDKAVKRLAEYRNKATGQVSVRGPNGQWVKADKVCS